MLSRRRFIALWPVPALAARGQGDAADYLGYVRKFADTLLAKGLDAYGPRRTPLWAGVIDAATMTVPREAVSVPPPEGIRPQDRAVGGCNLYHDVVTLRVFHVLGALTKEPRYARAARDYASFFLAHAQNPQTGLLGWGEHLYYDFFRDEVAVERRSHELLEWTPPWPVLWDANPEAVSRAIAGIRYHFYADDPSSLFNRHAYWDRAEHQPPGGQPWIKHTGLYCYSFLFLYAKTGDPLWLRWARGTAELYWKHRNPGTNLTLGCIGDKRPSTQDASPGMTELAYWLYKGWQLAPAEKQLRERARAYLAAFDRYFYDRERESFRTSVSTAGEPLSEDTMRVWNTGYGELGPLPIGRIAAYIGRHEKEPAFIDLARRAAAIGRRTAMPDNVSQECVAFALNLSLDLYDHARNPQYLAEARRYADTAIERFWYGKDGGGLFVRVPKDPYYEAKVGTGDLVAGLLRLHLRLNPSLGDPGVYDWSY